MHSHIYGKKHFKYKTNFKDLVVFSDVTQNKIKTELPSEALYFEVEKGYKNQNKWFIHLNSTLSGEYGDFYTEENPVSLGEIKGLEYDSENNLNEALKGFLIGEALPYYKINGKFYVKIEDASLLNEVFVGKQPENKEKNIEYDAFTTVFISEDGAKLLQAYEAVKQVNAHEVVVFIERNSGSNLFGTVFRIKKGKNVKTLIETNRIRIAEIARAYGVGVLSNELSKMMAQELSNKKSESSFYFVLAKGGAIVRWGSDVTLGTFSDLTKEVGKGIDSLKLGENYWKTEIDGKENKEYKPLLPKLKIDESFSSEEVANKVYNEFIVPIEKSVTLFVEKLNTHWLLKQITPFKSSQITGLFQYVPKIIKEFLDKLKGNIQNTYDFINGLLVGLLNSIIDFFKSIFDILAILFDVINGVMQTGKFFEKPGHYLRLLAEGFENIFDLVTNIFTLENLKSWINFLVYMPKATVKLLTGVFTKASNAEISIDPGAMGYYIGFLVGFIVSEVVTFFATGGTGNIAKGVKAVLQSYKELAKIAAKTVVKTAKLTVESFLTVIRKLKEFAKNLPKHLDTLKSWVDELIAKSQAKVLVVDNVTYSFVDPVSLFASTIFKIFKASTWKKLNGLGVNMVKNEEGLYSFVFNNKSIAKDLTKKQTEEFLKELFIGVKDKGDEIVEKYLDDLAKRKKARTYLIKDVPGVKYFVKWFDDLSFEEFNLVWDNVKLSRKIKSRLRYPGGLHEWLMVSRANVFKGWGVSANEIITLRTKIKEVIFVKPDGVHGGKGSTKAHNEILRLIDSSKDYPEFVEKLINWADNRLKGGSRKLPKGFFKENK